MRNQISFQGLSKTVILLALTGVIPVAAVAQDSWPQWRGPSRTGVIQKVAWPESIGEDTLVEQWRLPLQSSYSGPIVVGDTIYTTETRDKKTEVVTALSRKDGKVLWTQQWDGAMKVPFFAASNGSWIRSTPAYSDGKLFVAGMKDVLVCLDAESGEVVWKRDFPSELKTPVPSFGFVCSPLVDGDVVYVQAAGGLIKLEANTGKTIWLAAKDGGGMFGSAFSSPVLADIRGVKQLVVQSRTKLLGVDTENGEELWSEKIPAFRGMNILTPTIIGNNVFTSSYGGKTVMFNVAKEGDAWSVSLKWENKSQGYMSSPVVVDDHIYLHLRNQRFSCIHAETGEDAWKTPPHGKYWSMITNGNKILALDARGKLMLIGAGADEFSLIEERTVSDQETWAHVATAGDNVYVRSLNEIIAYKWKK